MAEKQKVIDEAYENMLASYAGTEGFRKVFSRDPDNYKLREQLKDENGQAMYSQSEGLVQLKFKRDLENYITELSARSTEETYKAAVSAYPVSDNLIGLMYVELAKRNEIAGKDASDGLKKIAKMAKQADELEDTVAMKKYDDAVEMLESMTDGNLDAELAYQYQAIGQNQNVASLALRYAHMHRQVAKAKVTPEIKAEVDKAIAKDNKTRALAVVERYRVYQTEQQIKARESKKK